MATFTLRAVSCDDELGAALDDALGTLEAPKGETPAERSEHERGWVVVQATMVKTSPAGVGVASLGLWGSCSTTCKTARV